MQRSQFKAILSDINQKYFLVNVTTRSHDTYWSVAVAEIDAQPSNAVLRLNHDQDPPVYVALDEVVSIELCEHN